MYDWSDEHQAIIGVMRRFVNEVISKSATPVGAIVEAISGAFHRQEVAKSLDAIKNLGFRYATKSGLTIAIADVVTTKDKAAILPMEKILLTPASNDDARVQAARVLGAQKDAGAAAALEKALADKSLAVRKAAADSLADLIVGLPTSMLVAATRTQTRTIDFATSNLRGSPIEQLVEPVDSACGAGGNRPW